MAERCNFESHKEKEENIKVSVIMGLLDKNLSTKLQLKEGLTPDSVIHHARQAKLVNSQMSDQTQGVKDWRRLIILHSQGGVVTGDGPRQAGAGRC